jgi:hypothetical protein
MPYPFHDSIYFDIPFSITFSGEGEAGGKKERTDAMPIERRTLRTTKISPGEGR